MLGIGKLRVTVRVLRAEWVGIEFAGLSEVEENEAGIGMDDGRECKGEDGKVEFQVLQCLFVEVLRK